ncbi:MAG: transporter [Rikenellaceae bacterium]
MINFDFLRSSSKSILMVISMALGVLFYYPLVTLDQYVAGWITPIVLAFMLFISCCGVDFTKMKISPQHLILLGVQMLFSICVFVLTLPLDSDVAGGLLVCSLTPVAIASVVMVKLMGAKVDSIITFSLLSNTLAAIYLPFILSLLCGGATSTWDILQMVMPVIIIPMVLSQVFRLFALDLAVSVSKQSGLSLALWLMLILFIYARTTKVFISSYNDIQPMTLSMLMVGSMVICVAQFLVGKIIGAKYGDGVTGAQALGQKNTILAVWLASSFISPIAALAPTAYIIWQNVINTYRIYHHESTRV